MVVEGGILLLMIITATTITVMIIGKKYSSYDAKSLTIKGMRENYDNEINSNNCKYN